jgi:hypothetical protein
MKKLNRKLLVLGLTILFFSLSIVFLVRAQEEGRDFFRVNSASTTPAGSKRAGDEALIHIVNRSGKSYFAPNKTLPEFESFRNNAPNYVAVSVCGDGVCGEGENIGNCDKEDCKGPDSLNNIGYCGDTICGERVVCTTTPETITVSAAEKFKICDRSTFWGWLYSEVVVPAVENAYYFLGVTERANFCASGQYTTSVLKCENVGSESWETCPDDCVPTSSSGCGVCGYDGAGNLCPNLE